MDYQFIDKKTSSTIIKALIALTQSTLLGSSLRILLVRLVIDYCTNPVIWSAYSSKHSCIKRIIENKLEEYSSIGTYYRCMFQPFVSRIYTPSLAMRPTPCVNTQDVYFYLEYRLYGPYSIPALSYRSGWSETSDLRTGYLIVDGLILLESSALNERDKAAIRAILNEYIGCCSIPVPKEIMSLYASLSNILCY